MRSRPSNGTTSTPSGASSAAARSSAVLCDAARRLPEMVRICMGLCGLDRGHADEQLDLVGHEQVAVRERLIPLEVEVAAVDHARELEADALVAPRVGSAFADDAGELDRLGDALDRDLAVETDLAIIKRLAGGRGERDLRVVLGVEEVGRRQVAVTLRVTGIDARDLDRAVH